MDVVEALDYQGVISSHSWSTPDTYPRIYKDGGFITPYAGDSTGFVDKWRTPRRLGRPALLLGHRLRRRHQRPRRAGRPARHRRAQQGDLPVQGPRRRDRSTSSTPASGSTTSTPTASRSTASTPTGSRTSPRSPAAQEQGRQGDPRRHVARLRGLPADVGACRGRRPRLVPQPRPAQERLRGRAAGQAAGSRPSRSCIASASPSAASAPTYGFCAKAPGKPKVMVTIHFSPAGRVTGVEV